GGKSTPGSAAAPNGFSRTARSVGRRARGCARWLSPRRLHPPRLLLGPWLEYTTACAPSNHAASSESGECRGIGQALPGTRTTGDFSRPAAGAWRARRSSEGLLDAVCVRGVPEKMDSPALAFLPACRCKSRGRRSVAQSSSSAARNKDETAQHHERIVFARHS